MLFFPTLCAFQLPVVDIMATADPEAFTLLSLGLVFIIIRIYVRWTSVGPANFQVDDYLMPLAGVSMDETDCEFCEKRGAYTLRYS